MIKSFYIDGFRNLNRFTLCHKPDKLSSTTFLVGLNGVGKSNVLEALRYVQQLATGSATEKPAKVQFKVVVSSTDIGEVSWAVSYNQKLEWYNQVIQCNKTVLFESKENLIDMPKGTLYNMSCTSPRKSQLQQAISTLLESLNCIKIEDNLGNNTDHTKIEALAKMVLSRRIQTFCSTNSVLLLNYLPDDVAKAGVVLLYKGISGNTEAVRLFDLPGMYISWQGPGKAYCHTGSELTEKAQTYAALNHV
jgi:AAA15 family ATPase/GTPase